MHARVIFRCAATIARSSSALISVLRWISSLSHPRRSHGLEVVSFHTNMSQSGQAASQTNWHLVSWSKSRNIPFLCSLKLASVYITLAGAWWSVPLHCRLKTSLRAWGRGAIQRALASYKIGNCSGGIRTSGLEVLRKGVLMVLPMQSGAVKGNTAIMRHARFL